MYSIYKKTLSGKHLDKSLYVMDEESKTIINSSDSEEIVCTFNTDNDCILDFTDLSSLSFETSKNCTFPTDENLNVSVEERNGWVIICFIFLALIFIVL